MDGLTPMIEEEQKQRRSGQLKFSTSDKGIDERGTLMLARSIAQENQSVLIAKVESHILRVQEASILRDQARHKAYVFQLFDNEQQQLNQQVPRPLLLQSTLPMQHIQDACTCTPILIVDDNAFNLFTLELMITYHFKLKCDQAFNGQEAVDKVQQRRACTKCSGLYKLMFMDISMPVLDGYEATVIIREIEAVRSYIVGLTAHNTQSHKDKCMESGMNEFSKRFLCYLNIFSD